MRQPIKKSLRFSIFARDGFACRYCGRKSDEIKLVIEHVIPVAKGGTNDESNLVSACDECNQGKGTKDAFPDPDNENVRLSRLQAAREQEEAAKAAVKALKADKKLREIVLQVWCDATGGDSCDKGTLTIMVKYLQQYGFAVVARWIRLAVEKVGRWNDKKIGMYVSGIRRKFEEEGWGK